MQSISNYEFATLNFLIRNFFSRYTVRQISLKLKASPAGIHKGLRKLEQDDVVKSEKLGTGLFYYINLENQIAKHLAAIVLLLDKPEKSVMKKLEHVKNEATAAMVKGNDLMLISHHHLKAPLEFTVTILTDHELSDKIRQRDKKILEFIQNGKLLWGENVIVMAIKEGMYRF